MFCRLWLFMLLALSLTAPFQAQNEAEIYRAVSPSVVSIEVEINRFDTGGGAGFVIDQDGHIVTNAHVVEDARTLTVVFHDGYETSARLIGIDTDVDLAVIKVDAARHRLKPVTFGDSDAIVIGEAVVAIGSPHGLDATLTRGIISGLNRRLEFDDGKTMEGAIQTDATLAPGNSGGPLVNQMGEVIGVNTAINIWTLFGFAIPSNNARRVAESMIVDAEKLATIETIIANWEAIPAQDDSYTRLATAIAQMEKCASVPSTNCVTGYATAEAMANSAMDDIDRLVAIMIADLATIEEAAEGITSYSSGYSLELAFDITWIAQLRPELIAAATEIRPAFIATVTAIHVTGMAKQTEQAAAVTAIHVTEIAKQTEQAATTTAIHVTGIAKQTKQAATINARKTDQFVTAWAEITEYFAELTSVTTPTATSTARPKPTATPYHVTVDGAVNLRSGPGTAYPIIGAARPGDAFAVVGYRSGNPYNWLYVRYGGGHAWIAESLTRRRG